MTFSDWLYEQESDDSVRLERLYEDLLDYQGNVSVIIKWLQAAYDAGYEHHQIELMDDGK